MNNQFTNKEEYLTYRSDWKVEYKALSQTIRDVKLMWRYTSQACNKAIQMVGGSITYDNVNKYFRYAEEMVKEDVRIKNLYEKYNNDKKWIRKTRNEYKKEATLMLEELKLAKIEANRQYLERKQSLQVVSV